MNTKLPRNTPVVIYARHSSARNPEDPFKEQTRHLRAQALKRGWEPVQVFHDGVGPSAIQRNPPDNNVDPGSGE